MLLHTGAHCIVDFQHTKMAKQLLLITSLLLCCSLLQASPAPSSRSLYQFKNMINHKGYFAFEYIRYGCWCGSGNLGPRTLDSTDQCCKTHDICYDNVAGRIERCIPKRVTYKWEPRSGRSIVCTDPVGTCDRNACECDKAAADCFQRHRSTYNASLNNVMNTLVCKEKWL